MPLQPQAEPAVAHVGIHRLKATSVHHKIEQAVGLGALKRSLKPERKPREWTGLVEAGTVAFGKQIAERMAQTACSFPDETFVAQLLIECSSCACMAAAYRALSIDSCFTGTAYQAFRSAGAKSKMNAGEESHRAAKLLAILGELHEGGLPSGLREQVDDAERELARSTALSDLRDMILLMGLDRLGYKGDSSVLAMPDITVSDPLTISGRFLADRILPTTIDEDLFARFSLLTLGQPVEQTNFDEIDEEAELAAYEEAIYDLLEDDSDDSRGKGTGKGKGKRKGKGHGLGLSNVKAGDWTCPCGDNVFARNSECRKCGTARPAGVGVGGGRCGYNNENTVFLRGLPWAVTEDALRTNFAKCGEIERINMPMNEGGKSRGLAFIEYKTPEGVEAALRFDYMDYGGRIINVSKAEDNGKAKDGSRSHAKAKGKDGSRQDARGKGRGKSVGKREGTSNCRSKP